MINVLKCIMARTDKLIGFSVGLEWLNIIQVRRGRNSVFRLLHV